MIAADPTTMASERGASESRAASIGYRPEIDGLRAVAVLPVVLYHAGFAAFRGGFIGVDVFFVISGFLITSILKREIDARRFSLIGFYERRVRRIVPALAVMSAAVALAAYKLFPPDQLLAVADALLAVAFFAANIYFYQHAGYWDPAARDHPLLHTWSLGVEEQFYIVFPLLLAALRRWIGPGAIRWTLLGLAAASLAGSAWSASAAPQAGFYLAPFRAFELMIGALLVYANPSAIRHRWAREILGAGGLALIAASALLFSEATPFPGVAALAPCLGAAAVILAGDGGGSVGGSLLSAPPAVFIGRISYSLYLWHWPLIVFTRLQLERPFTALEQWGLVGASFGAATLSWVFVERPFRRTSRAFPGRRTVFALAGVAVAAAALAFNQAHVHDGWANRLPPGVEDIDVTGAHDYRAGTCNLDNGQPPSAWDASRCVITGASTARVFWWGDSFAAHYTPALDASRATLPFTPVLYSYPGCAPVFGFEPAIAPHCRAFNQNALQLVAESRARVVVLAARWEAALERGLDLRDLTKTVAALRGRGLTVVVIGESPVFVNNGARLLGWRRLRGRPLTAEPRTPPDLNERLRAAAAGAIFLDPSAAFCRGGVCALGEGRKAYFWDEGHFTLAGGLRALSVLDAPIGAAAAARR